MQLDKGGKHCARTTKRFLSVAETSTVTDAVNALATEEMFFETGITLPGRSDVSLAATTPCRLQLCTVSECFQVIGRLLHIHCL